MRFVVAAVAIGPFIAVAIGISPATWHRTSSTPRSGHPVSVTHPDDRDAVDAQIDAAITGDRPNMLESRAIHGAPVSDGFSSAGRTTT